MPKNATSTRNPFKTMYQGTTHNRPADGMHRPEGAGNFDNADDQVMGRQEVNDLVKVVRDIEVRRGNITGSVMVSIDGHNDNATTTRVTVAPTLETADIDQSGLHSTAITVDVASTDTEDKSDGTGLRTLKIEGLDSNGNAQTETITLNGQTEVTSTLTYSAINEFKGLTAGSGNESAGDIWIGNGTFTLGVPATKYFVGERGHNKGLTCYYTVPTGKTFFPRSLSFTVTGTNKEVELSLETSTDGIFWITEREVSAVSGTVIILNAIAAPGVVAGSHIRIRAEAGGAGTELTAAIAGELIDD